MAAWRNADNLTDTQRKEVAEMIEAAADRLRQHMLDFVSEGECRNIVKQEMDTQQARRREWVMGCRAHTKGSRRDAIQRTETGYDRGYADGRFDDALESAYDRGHIDGFDKGVEEERKDPRQGEFPFVENPEIGEPLRVSREDRELGESFKRGYETGLHAESRPKGDPDLVWLDRTNDRKWKLMRFDGEKDITLAIIDTATNTMTSLGVAMATALRGTDQPGALRRP